MASGQNPNAEPSADVQLELILLPDLGPREAVDRSGVVVFEALRALHAGVAHGGALHEEPVT